MIFSRLKSIVVVWIGAFCNCVGSWMWLVFSWNEDFLVKVWGGGADSVVDLDGSIWGGADATVEGGVGSIWSGAVAEEIWTFCEFFLF